MSVVVSFSLRYLKMTFKTDDWVIYKFTMHQITEINEHGVTTISDGHFCTSGNFDDSIHLATPLNKCIADDCNSYYRKLKDNHGSVIRNWPDLNRWFSNHCYRMIDASESGGTAPLYAELEKMYNDIHESATKISKTAVNGVKLYT